MSECCVQGYIHNGTPTGTITELNGIQVYISTPPTPFNPSKAILILPDVFGHTFKNTQLISDKLSTALNCTAYLFDLHTSDSIPSTHIPDPSSSSWLSTIKSGLVMATHLPSILPWFNKHGDKQTLPILKDVFEALSRRGVTELGCIGFCWGGRYSILLGHQTELNTNIKVKGIVAAHPSFVKVPKDIEALKVQSLFLCAESDGIFTSSMCKQTEKIISNSNVGGKLVIYEKTSHGFVNKGPEHDLPMLKAREEALNETISFFKNV